MRSYDEMMSMILSFAETDDRIRAVTMEGSRASKSALHDRYSDFDITFFVTDSRPFTTDRDWVRQFGEILILQCPEDWYSHPYDPESRDPFAFLIQFADGNRIDLGIKDLSRIEDERSYDEPRIVLLKKDELPQIVPIPDESVFYVQRPSAKEYFDVCNEFRWVSVYAAKGLCREQLYYAKYAFDQLMMNQFIKMLGWVVGVRHDFSVSVGGYGKYFKKYLTADELARFHGIFPNGEFEDIWEKLFKIYDFFAENAQFVAEKLGFAYDADETARVRAYIEKMRREK